MRIEMPPVNRREALSDFILRRAEIHGHAVLPKESTKSGCLERLPDAPADPRQPLDRFVSEDEPEIARGLGSAPIGHGGGGDLPMAEQAAGSVLAGEPESARVEQQRPSAMGRDRRHDAIELPQD